MRSRLNKKNLQKTENKINRNIYLLPIILGLIVIMSFTFIIYSSVEDYREKQLNNLSLSLIDKEKLNSKKELEQIIKRIEILKKNTETQLKKNLKNRIDEAYSIIQHIIKEHPNTSQKKLKKLISIALEPIRFFNGRGYYFVYDKDTKKSIIHPIKKFIGKDMSSFRDKKNQLLVNLYDEAIKATGEGYANIYFIQPKKKDNKEYKKIVFVKNIPELNWVIGTGDYYDDVEKEVQKKVLHSLSTLRYGKHGYFWVHNTNHILLMHPFRKKSIGHNDINLQDSKKSFIVQEFVKKAISNPQGSFVEYYWKKPNNKSIEYKKISYVQLIPEWNWVIGTGVYFDDIDTLIKNEVMKNSDNIYNLYKKIIILGILFLFFIISTSIYFSKGIKKEFNRYAKALQNMNNNLENMVDKKTKELQELNNNLKERIEEEVLKNKEKEAILFEQSKHASMGEMIGNIAHQWRQPLSAISTTSTGLQVQKELGILSSELLNKSCDIINNNAQYLSKTIDDFRDFIKGDSKIISFKLSDDIESFLHLIEGSIKNHNVKIVKDLDDSIIINGYPNELMQCFLNIFNNSQDIFKEKNMSKSLFFISTYIQDDKAIITFKDNAGGVPDNIIHKIFEPYFTTKHQSKGTGLGLHMTYKLIVNGMGGTITVDNVSYKYEEQEYSGAQFSIALPLSL